MKIFVVLVHLIFATTWLGSAFFYTVVLQPKLGALEAAERRALARSLRATMTPLLATSALLTIASGLVMMVQLHHLHPGSSSHTRWGPVSYTHLRAHETRHDLVCRLLLENKKGAGVHTLHRISLHEGGGEIAHGGSRR